MRSRLHIGQSRRGIHERAAVVAHLITLGIQHHQLAVSLLESQVNGVGQALAVLVGHLEAVHHEFHTVVDVAVELHPEGNLAQCPIDTHVHVALLAQVLKQVLVMALAVLDQRSQDVYLVTLVTFQYQTQDLVGCVLDHALARQVGIGVGSTGIEQPQVVIHLGRRADGTARVAVHGLLPYRDDRTQAGYLIHVGALKYSQHVAGIGGKCLQIAPLPLGKNGVERQRRLAAAAQPRDDGELVMRYLHIDVLEVMDTRAQHLHAIYILPVEFHVIP